MEKSTKTFRSLIIVFLGIAIIGCRSNECEYYSLHDRNRQEIVVDGNRLIVGMHRQMRDNITLTVLKIDSEDCTKYKSFSGSIASIDVSNEFKINKEDNSILLEYRDVRYNLQLDESSIDSLRNSVEEFVNLCKSKYSILH